MTYNYSPAETHTRKVPACRACGSRVAEWNGHDGIYECADCGAETPHDSINEEGE